MASTKTQSKTAEHRHRCVLTYSEALARCVPTLRMCDAYHELRLCNEESIVKRYFVPRDEEIPASIEYLGVTYTFGQVSGPAMSIVWFE